jgi:hypothetical protein
MPPHQLDSTRARSLGHRIALLASLLGFGAAATGCDDGPPPSNACCNPDEQPGAGGSPLCVEGATCCANGTWSCNDADGDPFCERSEGVCTAAECDPGLEQGVGDNAPCFEAATCCLDGQWQCNDANDSPTCQVRSRRHI